MTEHRRRKEATSDRPSVGAWGSAADQHDWVAFRLAHQTYMLPIEPIVRIIEMVTITPIPHVGKTVEGVINMHGKAVLVINMRRYFGLPEASLGLRTPIIIVQLGQQKLGLIVDEVIDVLSLSDEQISRVVDILPEGLGEAPVLRGLAHIEDDTVLLINVEHLLSPSQVQALVRAITALPDIVTEETAKDVAVASVAGSTKSRSRRKAKS